MLSGAAGQFYGNHYTWPFSPDWQKHVDDKVRGTLETITHAVNPWAAVNKDVKALTDRIAELEGKLHELEAHEAKDGT